MDLSSAWKVLVRFQKTIIATSAHMYAKEQEQNLVHEFFEQMPVDLLYACLQDASDRGSAKQVKQACDCINRVLSAEGDGSSLFFQPDIVPYVLAGLAHVETKARVLVLSQFIAQLNRNPPLDKVRVVADAPVLKQICRIIADDDAEVAAKASTVLIKLSGIPDSSFYLVVLDSLKSQRSEIPLNSIEYTRYLETVAKICAQSDTHMNYGISTGAITLILNCLESDDPLFLMNIVDLVPVICQTKLGVQYIFRSGTLTTLLAMTEDPFVGGNAIRLVGEVSATAAALITESWAWGNATLSKAFLETVESKFQSPDSLQRMAAMDALAAFASSSEKELQLLLQHRNICRLWLQSGRSAELTIKTNCCHSLARVLGAPTRLSRKPEEVLEENASIWSMCERLFNSLGEECAQKSTMNLLMNALKQPFHELRTSVFHILRSVAAQNNPWGMRALLSYGGFFEFIMDRNTEPTKETREWKFAVLDAVLASPFKLLLVIRGDGMDSPRRAAFLCTSTASFQPPDWACMPADSNLHARLEAFRDGRQCATYMVATQRVNLFGRDQESCDHVLGNPSVSRKHAAVIHDDEGGIYMVDLMSRHGTYVGRKKIPPHDPYLLHDGDVIRFGQSVRLYILKGASSNGSSAPVKKSWGHRLRVPHVNISAVVTKKSPGKPKASSAVIKLVNAVCYGSLKDEKVGTFLSGVLELGVKDRHGVADVLVERLQAKYEFYASHVHRNAFVATMALLKQNLCVQELEDNLDVFTHISQQRNDNIYRADARKLLQAIAAVRLDPDNPQFADPDTTEEDVGSACPPTANNREGRERSISEEGKKLSAHGMQLPYRAESVGTSSDLNSNHRERFGDSDIRHQTSNYKISNQHNDHDGDSDIIASCAPLSAIRCGMKSISVSSLDESVVNRIELPSSESTDPTGSAFTFISDSNPVNDDDSCASSTGQPFEHLSTEVISGSSTNAAEEFLLERPTVSGSEFALMWESANEELEEWSVEFGCVDAHELDPRDLESFLQSYRLVCVSSEKLAGQQQGAFIAEQKSEGTMFLVQISVMPGLTDMFVTLKWIVNSLLYRNGHIIFMKILKHALYQFAGQVQTRGNKLYTYSPAVSQKRLQSRSGREPDAMKAQSITYSVIHSASRTVSHATSLDDEEKVDDGDSGDEGTMLARNHLVESPSIDAGKFEEVWATAIKIASISFSLNEIPEVDEVIEHFRSNCLSCLASGSLDKLFKFFFFAEMTELQCVFCVELMIGVDSGNLEGTIKRLSIRKHSEDEEEQIDSSFVSFIENVLQELLSA